MPTSLSPDEPPDGVRQGDAGAEAKQRQQADGRERDAAPQHASRRASPRQRPTSRPSSVHCRTTATIGTTANAASPRGGKCRTSAHNRAPQLAGA